jgi:hypothetical protein
LLPKNIFFITAEFSWQILLVLDLDEAELALIEESAQPPLFHPFLIRLANLLLGISTLLEDFLTRG